MKKCLPFLILALMLAIFLFSAQESAETNAVSYGFCDIAAALLFDKFDSFSTEIQTIISEGMNHFIRKLAHFVLYALMGALCYLWLCRRQNGVTTALSIVLLYASLDELHQTFVPGRTGRITDVLLDCTGAACGIAAAFVLLCLVHCLKDGRIVKRGVWRK